MATFDFSTKLEILPPKIDMKNNTPKMKRAINAALVEGMIKSAAYVQRDLRVALDQAMDSSVWSWDRNTLRTNGSTAGTVRDIVDTGKLRGSLTIKEKNLKTKTTLSIQYKAPYAALVHYGGAVVPYGNVNASTVLIPARPWIEATLRGTHGIQKFSMSKPMNDGFNEVWSRRFG
jgi:phage gpG-like protein